MDILDASLIEILRHSGQSPSMYERGFQHMKVTPLVLPSLDKGIYGAKPSSPDF